MRFQFYFFRKDEDNATEKCLESINCNLMDHNSLLIIPYRGLGGGRKAGLWMFDVLGGRISWNFIRDSFNEIKVCV